MDSDNTLRLFRWWEEPLHLFVNSTIGPENPVSDLGVDPKKPICYVLNSSSVSDLLVLQRQCRRLRLPLPDRPLSVNGEVLFSSSYICLSRLGLYKKIREGGQEPHSHLLSYVRLLESDPNLDVQLVPVTIFWGRNPGREERSLMKLLFFDDEHAGILQKAFIVMAQGRDCSIRFSKPISLRSFLNEEQSAAEQKAQKLRRVLRVHFRQQRTALLGPLFYERNQAIRTIVAGRQVREAIEEEMRKKSQSHARVEAKAIQFAEEIAADTRYGVIRFFDIVLTWLWNRIFDGIDVRNVESVPKVVETHSIVYVPCHRSHLDYLLISFSLFRAGLAVPHTAAGINLNFWPIGALLRRGGAFYIRRSFKGNRLYQAVFNEYLHFLVARGYPVKFFLEGGRSRTGKLLHPKTGMLSMVLQSFLRNPDRPVALQPVYVGYDKVMEVKTYLRELRGSGKKQESVGQLLKARKILKNSHGKAYLSFGEPITLKAFLDKSVENWTEDAGRLEQRPSWMARVIEELAMEVMRGINNVAIISPMSIISLALLSTPQRAMTESDLCSMVDFLIDLAKRCRYGQFVNTPDADARTLLNRCEKFAPIRRFEHSVGDVIYLDEAESGHVGYYRSNAMHLFALPALLASYFQHNDSISEADLVEGCKLLYPFLAYEYFLKWHHNEVESVIREYIQHLVGMGLIERSAQDREKLHRSTVTSETFANLMSLAHVLGQAIQRYGIAAALLYHSGIDGVVKREDLELHCEKLSQRISILTGVKDPDIVDKSIFPNLISVLKEGKYVSSIDGDGLRILPSIKSLAEKTMGLLSEDLRQSIERTTLTAMRKP